jgi:hypothetical protein
MRSSGHGPSQGIEPSARRSEIAAALAFTSSYLLRSKGEGHPLNVAIPEERANVLSKTGHLLPPAVGVIGSLQQRPRISAVQDEPLMAKLAAQLPAGLSLSPISSRRDRGSSPGRDRWRERCPRRTQTCDCVRRSATIRGQKGGSGRCPRRSMCGATRFSS